MIIYDFEVFEYDWLVVYLDTKTRKFEVIVNSKSEFEQFYEKYKSEIWVGYNSRSYDQWIAKAILCDFNPYEMNDWIINKDQKGFMFSRLLNKFPIISYDTIKGFKSLKELEGYLGHDIQETSIPFNIDRKLTTNEISETIKYCKHDVLETFHVFVNMQSDFESHVGLLQEYNLPLDYLSKTKVQLSAIILGANKTKHNDEFDISIPDTLKIGRYSNILNFYTEWGKNVRDYKKMTLKVDINNVEHVYGIGGLHGAKKNYIGDGYFFMFDVALILWGK